MDLESVNAELRSEITGELTLRSFEASGRRLVLTFVTHGGPREMDEFVVTFSETILVHLPSILHAPVRFRLANAAERERLIPPISFDADEVSGTDGAYTVVILEDDRRNPYGYYLAAEGVSATWRRR